MEIVRLYWANIAILASKRLNKQYSGKYCREVYKGQRSNATLKPILESILTDYGYPNHEQRAKVCTPEKCCKSKATKSGRK